MSWPRRTLGLAIMAMAASSCQSVAAPEAIRATVDLADAPTRAVVSAVLAKAMHRKAVVLGPTAMAETNTITVLPPPLGPYDTNSPALPIYFDIVQQGGKCVAVRRDTKAVYDLPGVDCGAVTLRLAR